MKVVGFERSSISLCKPTYVAASLTEFILRKFTMNVVFSNCVEFSFFLGENHILYSLTTMLHKYHHDSYAFLSIIIVYIFQTGMKNRNFTSSNFYERQ